MNSTEIRIAIGIYSGILFLLVGIVFYLYLVIKDALNKKPETQDKGGYVPQTKYKVYDPNKDPLRIMEGKVDNQFDD